MAGRNNVVYASSSFTYYFKAATVKLLGSIKQKVSDSRFEIYSKIREKLFGMSDSSNHVYTGSSQARVAPLNSKSDHLSTRVTYPLWISDIFFFEIYALIGFVLILLLILVRNQMTVYRIKLELISFFISKVDF